MKHTFWLLLVVSIYMQAQPLDSENSYIITFDGQKHRGQILEYKKPFLIPAYILLDTTKYTLNQVKFYADGENVFANTKVAHPENSHDKFAKCIYQGNLNLYRYLNDGTHMTVNATTGAPTTGGSRIERYYYNKGYESVKRLKYRNLIADNLQTCDASKSHLQSYKQLRRRKNVFIYAGIGLIGGGIITLTQTANSSASNAPGAIMLGAGLFSVSYLQIMLGDPGKHLIEAVKVFKY